VTTLSYSATAIRCGAVVAAVVLTLAAGATGWAWAGPRAGAVAALLTCVVGAGPFLEGYQLGGELAGSAVATAGVAAAAWWRRRDGGPLWLLAAALACGAAPTIKPSALDGAAALLALVATRPDRRRRHLLLAGLGLALPLGAAAAHGAATGWSRWWSAVIAFQGSLAAAQSPAARVASLGRNLLAVAPDLAGLAVVALVGAVLVTRSTSRRWPALVWVVTAGAGASAGPFAHPHYWLQAVAPLAVLAATAVARCRPRQAGLLLALALAVPVLTQGFLAVQPPARRVELVFAGDPQRRADADVASWLRAHTDRADPVYAFVAGAELYLLADRTTGYRYLWLAPVEQVPGARVELRDWLDGAAGPRWVVVYQPAGDVDPSGELGSVLGRRYRQVAVVDGFGVLERRG
jgi:hypothetical protein